MKLKVMTYNIASGREMGMKDNISVIPMPDILGLNGVREKNGDSCIWRSRLPSF